MALSKDEKYIKRCFTLAKKGLGKVEPNPMVGCVIVKNEKIISEGYHQKYGDFHAERNAILKAKEKELIGSTLYVNLEPCSHFGKTPPCVDLIIEKKIKRVCFSNLDLNPKVSSVSKLQQAGIEVQQGILEDEGYELNKVFFKNIQTSLPYIVIKTATTLDSKIADKNYSSKWITDEYSRLEVMKLRNRYQAILSGGNTVLYDNPHLTSRIKGGKNPIRIIIDRKGKIDNSAYVFENNARIIVVSNSNRIYPPYVEKIPYTNLYDVMKTLYKMGITSIMIEAGGNIGGAFLKNKLVDEIYQFVAPKILGVGIDFTSGLMVGGLANSIMAKDLKIKKLKNDILLNYKLEYPQN